ncbi:DUF2283 domain-containing protein [Candidatus Electronema sp. TJ]|uniref:DUF2283 domain-containing protein n=1 Tax=Candidatus Electronema sp. TJ TaxID=3401573 RepID=UPI003AA930A2
MRVKYFSDTDTALIEFGSQEISETREVSENIYLDLDQHGNVVSMTIEHARTSAALWEFSYQELSSQTKPARPSCAC